MASETLWRIWARRLRQASRATIIAGLLGAVLHLGIHALLWSAGEPDRVLLMAAGLAIFAWALAPYTLAALLSTYARPRIAAATAAFAALAFDVHTVRLMLDSTRSTAGLMLLFGPLCNLVLVVPGTTGMIWLVSRAFRMEERTGTRTRRIALLFAVIAGVVGVALTLWNAFLH